MEADDLSDCDLESWTGVCAVLDVTVVLVSPSSVVAVCFGGAESVQPQSSSLSKKRAHVWTVSQEEMRYESSPVKVPPPTRRRTMPPTPLHSSHSSYEERQWQIKQGHAIFETFSSEGPSEFLVVSRARWDEDKRKMSVQKEGPRRMPLTLQQNSFSLMSERQWQADLDEQHDGWSFSERTVLAAREGYLEKCINIKVEIAALELSMEPEDSEVCLRYILKHAKRKGSSIFEIFDTKDMKDHLWQAGGVGWSTKEEGSFARKRAK